MFPVPHEGDSLILRRAGAEDVVEHLGTRTSYTYQLAVLADALVMGTPVLTDADWAVANMRLVDAAYASARIKRRLASSGAGGDRSGNGGRI